MSISKQKATARVAIGSPRVRNTKNVLEELRDFLWVAKCKHFQTKSCCASGHRPSPRPLNSKSVLEELRDPVWVA